MLLRVHAIAAHQRDQLIGPANSCDLRRRAFETLRELLARVAQRQLLVVSIDDLQWADTESVVLLEELLRPRLAPAMLTLLSFRSEETADKAFLRALLGRAGRDIWSAVALDSLTEDEAHTLIEALVPPDSRLNDKNKRRMTREAGGSPFVLAQLARYAGVSIARTKQPPTFGDMFATRLAALSAEARRFLETLAICGRPMAADVICDACGIARERQSLVATLRAARFIRSSGSSERIETYHDRIRDALAASIAPDAIRRIHGRMLEVLLKRRSNDGEALFEHYRGAATPRTRRFRPALPARKRARPSRAPQQRTPLAVRASSRDGDRRESAQRDIPVECGGQCRTA